MARIAATRQIVLVLVPRPRPRFRVFFEDEDEDEDEGLRQPSFTGDFPIAVAVVWIKP